MCMIADTLTMMAFQGVICPVATFLAVKEHASRRSGGRGRSNAMLCS